MVSFVQRTITVLVLFLCVFGNSWIFPRDDPIATLLAVPSRLKGDGILFRRGNSGNCGPYISDPDTPDCEALCAPDSFSCSSEGLDERSLHGPVPANDSLFLSPRELSLRKRAFQAVTQQGVVTYLPNQFNGSPDPTFGNPIPLVQVVGGVETDATVTYQKEFSTTAFQVGARLLHGCTMVTVVSNKAVHMGHYWEVPSWSDTQTVFSENVLNFFGTGETFGQGPRLDPSLFQPGDDPRVYIMTPRRGAANYQSSNYRAKVPALISQIQQTLPGVPIAVWNYVRLRYDIPAEYAQRLTTQRGHAVFQYDPNAFGTGVQGWRLFYEEISFQSNNPPPTAAQAGGVPPLPPLPPNAS